MRVRRKRFADRLVAPRANPVRARTEAGILFDFRVMNVLMASDASETALEEALALPKPNGVVGEAARAAVRPIRWIRVFLLSVLENRKERGVIIIPRFEIVAHRITERVALSAHHRVSQRIETRL